MEKIKNSLQNIFRRRLAATLTIIGIASGVMLLCVIGALSATGVREVSSELDSLGLRGISVSINSGAVLKFSDAEKIEKLSEVSEAVPMYTQKVGVSANGGSQSVMLWGSDSCESGIFSSTLHCGRDFSKSELTSGDTVCIIDRAAAKSLFGNENVLGQTLYFNLPSGCIGCEIIGTTGSDSAMLQSVTGMVLPDFVYVPHSLMSSINGSETVGSIAIRIDSGADSKAVGARVKSLIEQDKGISGGVKIDDLSAQRGKLDNILSVVTMSFSSIGIFAMIISGLGVMTVMTITVSERTREIGIKKALGATFRAVFLEFLLDSLTISVIGGIIGLALGAAAIGAVGMIFNISPVMNISSAAAAFFGSVFFGAVFGLYPAVKAAKMNPAIALRYE